MNVLDSALAYADAGLCPIPILTNGTKRASVKWEQFQHRLPTEDEIRSWFSKDAGIGIVGGSVSENLEILDWEVTDVFEQWIDKVRSAGLLAILSEMPCVKTPSGGMHVYYRLHEPPPSGQKLAWRKTDGGFELLVETRASGNYVLAPGSPPECHENNRPYQLVSGSLDSIPVIDSDQRESLLDLARSFDEQPATPPKNFEICNLMKGDRPGDHFEQEASWTEILEPHGFSVHHSKGGEDFWQKPNSSDDGWHLTTGYGDKDLLYCFSSACPPFEPNKAYGKFAAYTLLNHAGNFAAAARELAGKEQGDTDSDGTVWLPPVLFGQTEAPDIPCSLLPGIVGQYAKAVSEHTQTPEGVAVMMMLSVLAACTQKRFEVSPYGDSYTEPLSVWTLTALPPASRKTAVRNLLLDPINDWESDQAKSMALEIAEHETEQAVITRRVDDLQKQAAKTEDAAERGGIIQEIAKLKAKLGIEKRSPRLWTADITPERLQGMLVEHGERMACISDEGGIFEVMSGLYSDGKVNIDVFLQSHAGTAIRVDRGSRTVYLNKPAFTFGLVVQPEIVSELAKGTKKRFRGNGALARFLYCIPKSNIGTRDVRRRSEIDQETKLRFSLQIHELLKVAPVFDERGNERPRILRLSADARDAWLDFAQDIEKQCGSGGSLESMQDWSGKLAGAAARIAALLHVAQYVDTESEIAAATMRQAIEICQLLKQHASIAFDIMTADPSLADARFIADWIVANHRDAFKQTELLTLGRFKNSKVDRLVSALDLLTERFIISQKQAVPTGGRPSYIYAVNPEFQNLFAREKMENRNKGVSLAAAPIL